MGIEIFTRVRRSSFYNNVTFNIFLTLLPKYKRHN